MRIVAQVDTISFFPNTPSQIQRTVHISFDEKIDKKSLETRKIASILVQKFVEKGLIVTSSKGEAEYIAFFEYGVDQGRVVTDIYTEKIEGVIGYRGSSTSYSEYGTSYGTSAQSETTYRPIYGTVGFKTNTNQYILYTREAKLEIIERETEEEVFDGNVVSVGRCHSFYAIAPYMIEAIFTDFPKGKIGTVNQKVDKKTYSC